MLESKLVRRANSGHEYIDVLNNKVFHEMKKNLTTKKNWDNPLDDFPSCLLEVHSPRSKSDKATLLIQHGEKRLEFNEGQLKKCQEEAREKLRHLDDRASDLFDILKYLWTIKANSVKETATVTLDEIAPFMGYEIQSHGTYHRDQKTQIDALMCTLSLVQLELDVEIKFYDEKGRVKRKRFQMKSPVLSILGGSIITDLEPDENGIKKIEYKWEVKPGSVLIPFLEQPNKQWAYVDKKILSFCPKKELYHKRIAKSAVYYLRNNLYSNNGVAQIRVRNLLDDGMIQIDHSRPSRMVERFEEVRSDLVVRDKILGSFEYKDYSTCELLIEQPRGWFERWLSSVVVLTAPVDLINFCKKTEVIDTKKLEIENESALIKKLLDFSTKEKISIKTMSEKFEVSRPFLSAILHGRKKPSQNILEQIKAFLTKCNQA